MSIGCCIDNPSSASSPSNILVGRASALFSTSSTGTTQIPADNTKPQNNEGDQYMTLSYTPLNANNILEIDVFTLVAASSGTTITMALFQDNGVDAIAAQGTQITAAGQTQDIGLFWVMSAGTASSTTFKVRIGSSNGATTVTFNGSASTQRYGGIAASGMRIREYSS